VLGLAAGTGDFHGMLAGPPHDHFGVVDARTRFRHLDLHGGIGVTGWPVVVALRLRAAPTTES